MHLKCTKKLMDYLGVKPENAAGDVEPLFEWTANLIIVNRRKVLVALHPASRCLFVLYGLTTKTLPKIPELILEGIRSLLQSEYVRPEIIEKYLDDCGRSVIFHANTSRSVVANCNKACERVKMFSDLFEPGDLYQKQHLPKLNDDIVSKDGYSYTYELLLRGLQERYGEDIQSCQALELEVELMLHTPCKRRIIVPEDLNLYQLHSVLQGAFEWHDYHLHQFVLERDRYDRPVKVYQPGDNVNEDLYEVEYLDSLHATVGEVFGTYNRIEYEYDFGDGWCHVIKLKHVIADCPNPYPHCIQAIGDAPMEDCGGPGGYAEVLKILRDPSHPEHQEISEWVRGSWWQPLDVEMINRRIKNEHRRIVPVYYR